MVWASDFKGYWLVDRRGRKYAFGSAIHQRFKEAKSYSYQPDELSVCPNGRIVRAEGFDYFGDVFGQKLLAPIVGVLPDSEYTGYYIFTEAGEVFAFGRAVSYGSLAEVDPTQYGISWKGYKNSQRKLAEVPAPDQARSTRPTPAWATALESPEIIFGGSYHFTNYALILKFFNFIKFFFEAI